MVSVLRRRLDRSPTDRSARGQGLVEFAIIVPVLMLVLLLALDFGRVFFGWVGLTNASRIGANFAAANPTAWGTPGDPADQATYEARILADAGALNCTPGTIPDPVFSGANLGDSATVTLTCTFSLITPLVSQILGGTVTIGAESTFPVRSGMIAGITVDDEIPPPPLPSMDACYVPSFIGMRVNNAQTNWQQAGFTTEVVITRPPSGNYTITSQSPAVGGQPVDCNTTIVTVAGE